ncbi:unnamed protein product [Sphagnum jensenii]|uniref:Desiccation-related protein PCC13-62 n=1 Tax=Sphagnum jensenii TaxID=128206 RepID=A0ABP1APC5_9BRYO
MAHISSRSLCVLFASLLLLGLAVPSCTAWKPEKFTVSDLEHIQAALNLEYLEAEFFLWGVFGYGLDKIAPELVRGGPEPIGASFAPLDLITVDILVQISLEEVGHLRALQKALGPYYFPRVQLDLSNATWGQLIDDAFGQKLNPPFNPYANTLNFLLGMYTLPYVGLTGYVGTSPLLKGAGAKALVAGLLGVEAGQDAVIRRTLWNFADKIVAPYNFTVTNFTDKVSDWRNSLSHAFVDEGLVVPISEGANGQTTGNVLAGNNDSLAFARTAEQVFATVYGTGSASKPGGFFPQGADGVIAKRFLKS